MSDDTKTVTITVSATGDITVDPTLVNLRLGQPIRWVLGDGEHRGDNDSLLLVFDDFEAVGQFEVRSEPGCRVAGANVGETPGLFHYKVIVSVGGKLFADVTCPSIRVK